MNTSAILPHVTATGVKNRSFRASTSTSQGGLQVSTAEWITPWVRWMPYTKHKPRGLMLPSSAGRHRLQHWLWGCQYGVSCSNETETTKKRWGAKNSSDLSRPGDDSCVVLLTKGSHCLAPPKDSSCGLVPLGGAVNVSTRGLRWDVTDTCNA